MLATGHGGVEVNLMHGDTTRSWREHKDFKIVAPGKKCSTELQSQASSDNRSVHFCPAKRSRKSFPLKLCPNIPYSLSSGECLGLIYLAYDFRFHACA